ncbi:toxin-antitoxin system YwqK family antitoxin [Chlamydia sp. 17-3921]|uniref:toxin-antitoxin system YwqK family antitoxin n=1 Tax=Chlamydia sp. 17-3921 TaxID=2675798 RepID=UPI001917F8F5|nr:hypothetical protein [Chlamydia sp. 17-3921]
MSIKKSFYIFLLLILVNSSAYSTEAYKKLTLTGINIVDRNGLSETICSKEKLKKYAKIDFLASQPYQKVMRMYKNKRGDQVSCLTTYHSNGQLKQYLECLNNRAYGKYREWHPNGKIKILAEVIGGIADLHPSAESSWLFDGETLAYNDEGLLEACIQYEKGFLEGTSQYYHSNQKVWKTHSYKKGRAHGEFLTYASSGALLKIFNYSNGEKHGQALYYDEKTGEELALEEYDQGLLMEGTYLDPQTKEEFSIISRGEGLQAIYGKQAIVKTIAFYQGKPHGKVTLYNNSGKNILQTYSLVNDQKEGEEIFFFLETGKAKLSLNWHEGLLQGTIKSWYPNGALESSKELINNKKSGLLTVYYPGGQIMAAEEYDNDFLIKGEYFRPEDLFPYTKVEKGCGTATFFTNSGTVTKKISYQDGKPFVN